MSAPALPADIAAAIEHLVAAAADYGAGESSNIKAHRAALEATILRYLSGGLLGGGEGQGAPFGTGSCPDGPNPSVSVHSDCDPSRAPADDYDGARLLAIAEDRLEDDVKRFGEVAAMFKPIPAWVGDVAAKARAETPSDPECPTQIPPKPPQKP